MDRTVQRCFKKWVLASGIYLTVRKAPTSMDNAYADVPVIHSKYEDETDCEFYLNHYSNLMHTLTIDQWK